MSSSPNGLFPRGKRPRTPQEEQIDEVIDVEEEPYAKVARRPSAALLPSPPELSPFSYVELPLAPRLKDYLAPGGISRYRPRQEWYRVQEENTTNTSSSPQSSTAAQSSSSPSSASPLNSPSFAHAPADGLLPTASYPDFLTRSADSTPHSTSAFQTNPTSDNTLNNSATNTPATPTPPPALFGKDWDHALHVAIRENATECALQLLDYGAPLELANAKRFTPLIVAAQKGNAVLVRELLLRGADPSATTLTGVSAVLQAAHFGRTQVLKLLLQIASPYLIEIANYNHTTPVCIYIILCVS